MIIGSHTIIQSKDADADRAFLRDVLGLTGIDAGGGWLIHALPPSELAVHPSEKNDVHEHYLICADVDAFVATLAKRGGVCSPIQDLRWGRLTQVTLPGGGKLGVYQALHARPDAPRAERAPKKARTAKARQAGKAPKVGKASKTRKTASKARAQKPTPKRKKSRAR